MPVRGQAKPGCEGGRNKKKYMCKANGCKVTPRGNDLANHYNAKTDWVQVKKMGAAVGDAALEKMLQQAGPHTTYIFEKGYSKKRLPHWANHVMVKEPEAEASSAGPRQLKIGRFFQVSNPAIGGI
jgi:hypothetical protein